MAQPKVQRHTPEGILSDAVAKSIIHRLSFGDSTPVGTVIPTLRAETHINEWVEHHDVVVEQKHIDIAQKMLAKMGSAAKL